MDHVFKAGHTVIVEVQSTWFPLYGNNPAESWRTSQEAKNPVTTRPRRSRSLSRALDEWAGLRGHVQVHISKTVEERAKRLGLKLPDVPAALVDPAVAAAATRFDIYCYICGLNFMVSGVRELLEGYGWHKKQIVFERYD